MNVLMHEDFIRCTNCDSAYFRKITLVTLDKLAFEQGIFLETQKVKYVCEKCGQSPTSMRKGKERDSLAKHPSA